MLAYDFSRIWIFLVVLGMGAPVSALPSGVVVSERKKALETTSERSSSRWNLFLGNEWNKNDGFFGPVTFGLLGSHQFKSGWSLQAGYIRIREPGMTDFQSALDSGFFAVRAPVPQGPQVGLSLWRNRLMEMHTTALGLEVASPSGSWGVSGYFGTASRAGRLRNFRALEFSASQSLGPVEISQAAIFGQVGLGWYRSLGFSLGVELPWPRKRPTTVSLSVQDNGFTFGKGGEGSEPQKELIVVGGIEIPLQRKF